MLSGAEKGGEPGEEAAAAVIGAFKKSLKPADLETGCH